MTRPFAVLCAVAVAGCAHPSRVPTQPIETPGRADVVAFVDVRVLPMSSDTVLAHHSVVVENGVITRVGPRSAVTVPSGATVIDGRGSMTLLPGLVDAHTHSTARSDFPVLLANGVTTILEMGQSSTSPVIASRDAIARGEVLGPRVYASWFIDGPGGFAGVVETPDAARAQVRNAAAARHEFVKVYNSLKTDQFQAVLDEAKAQKVAVIGHTVRAVGAANALRAGQVMLAHAEELLPGYFAPPSDTIRIPAAVDLLKSTGAYLTANLSAYETITRLWGNPAQLAELLALPEVRYLSAADRAAWSTRGYERQTGSLATRFEFLRALVRAMNAAGVPLLAGTDAPFVPGLVPGFAIHDELRNLVDAGLSPFDALVAATRTPGEFFRRYANGPIVGIVAEGARADLVLVAGDPLASVGALREPAGVMVAGRWLNRATLLRNLDGP